MCLARAIFLPLHQRRITVMCFLRKIRLCACHASELCYPRNGWPKHTTDHSVRAGRSDYLRLIGHMSTKDSVCSCTACIPPISDRSSHRNPSVFLPGSRTPFGGGINANERAARCLDPRRGGPILEGLKLSNAERSRKSDQRPVCLTRLPNMVCSAEGSVPRRPRRSSCFKTVRSLGGIMIGVFHAWSRGLVRNHIPTPALVVAKRVH